MKKTITISLIALAVISIIMIAINFAYILSMPAHADASNYTFRFYRQPSAEVIASQTSVNVGSGFTINGGSVIYTRLYVNVTNNVRRLQARTADNSSIHTFSANDTIFFPEGLSRASTAAQAVVNDAFSFTWAPDSSSPYAWMRSTLQHLLFGDADGVVISDAAIDLVSVLACLFVVLVPFVVVVIVLRMVLQ